MYYKYICQLTESLTLKETLKYITIWLFNIAMEKSTILKFGKPSISMGHLYHGYVSHNQRVNYTNYTALRCLEQIHPDVLEGFPPGHCSFALQWQYLGGSSSPKKGDLMVIYGDLMVIYGDF